MTAATPSWTNRSVLAFARGAEPLRQAKSAAQALLQRAREAGIAGPPVDVIALAELLGIELRPNDDVVDAQIVSVAKDGNDSLAIEYNPNRPRGRLRFSIAHELAHSRFADVASQPRHRTAMGAVPAAESDEWELELVCNVIAAELLLPERAVEGLLDVDPDIDFIMELRRRWDVSTESLLRRLVTSTTRPMAMVSISRRALAAGGFVFDYVDWSNTLPQDDALRGLAHGGPVVDTSAFENCVAVGQTVRGTFRLGDNHYPTQAVGVPGYPGSKFPRVLAILEPQANDRGIPGVEYVTADIMDFATSERPIVVAHVVSDAARGWSRTGVASTISRALPDFAQSFRAWAIADPDNLQLGNVHSVGREYQGRETFVVSMVAQEGFGPSWETRLRYDALADGLGRVAVIAAKHGAEVHIPRIGAGQAGGRWDFIERIVKAELVDRGVPVTIHTLPQKEATHDR